MQQYTNLSFRFQIFCYLCLQHSEFGKYMRYTLKNMQKKNLMFQLLASQTNKVNIYNSLIFVSIICLYNYLCISKLYCFPSNYNSFLNRQIRITHRISNYLLI